MHRITDLRRGTRSSTQVARTFVSQADYPTIEARSTTPCTRRVTPRTTGRTTSHLGRTPGPYRDHHVAASAVQRRDCRGNERRMTTPFDTTGG